MKRKQMIKLMASELIKYQARADKEVYNFEDAEKMCTKMLDFIEDAGMTPPVKKSLRLKSGALHAYDIEEDFLEWEL